MIFQLSTFNVQTLNSLSKMGEITALAEEQSIDIICIQEHRIFHEDINIRHENMGKGWMLLTSSAEKAENNSTIRGVGLLLSPKSYKALNAVEINNPRIMVASFNGNPCTTVISCYSPTNVTNEEEVIEFYHNLTDLTNAIPKHNVKIIGGDMNAKIGQEDAKGSSFHESTNRNGEYLLDFEKECDMIDLSVQYTKRKGKLCTFTYPNGVRAQLDHILINRKWKNSAINCEAYSTFSTVKSDHRIVTAKFRLSLRVNKNLSKNRVRYDWGKLIGDEDVRTSYTIDVKNRFEALKCLDDDNNSNSIYNNIVNAHENAAEANIPKMERKKNRIPWENKEIIDKREKLKEAYESSTRRLTRANKSALDNAKQKLDEAYKQELEAYIQEKTNIIQHAAENQQSSLAWATVNEITGRKKTDRGKLKAKNPKDRIQKWKEHFSNLLGQPPNIIDQPIINVAEEDLPINTNDFTKEELRDCIKTFANGKTPGLDNIPVEVWKTEALLDPLLEVCNKTMHQDKADIWVKSGLVPLPKKGDLGYAKQYRGISLSVIAAKIYNKMILLRLRPHVEPILRINQNGFRPGRSTLSQILTIRRLIEGIKDQNLQAVMTFVDFSKAFDSIHRGKLMQILRAYGIPDTIVGAINILYKDTVAQVLSPDGDTEFFEILAGVLQGDTLAPFLFIVALDYALRIATLNAEETGLIVTPRKSTRHPAIRLTDTDFADDIALTSNTIKEAQLLLQRVEEAAKQIGLHVNDDKTEFMVFNQPEGIITSSKGKNLKCVSDFKYLGSWIESSKKDIGVRIGLAWSAMNKMSTIWDSNLPNKLKIQFFRAAIESILIYGSECWTLTKALESKLNGTYTKMLRRVKNISWKQHLTNTLLYGGIPPLTETIKHRRLKFVAHCWRRREEVVHQVLLWEPVHGKRGRGRPCRTYVQQLLEDTNLERNHVEEMMEDRVVWRRLVKEIRVRSTR